MTQLVRLTTAQACRDWVAACRSRGETVGLVPTMGALHAGHASLVEASAAACDQTIATIFVNPRQFAPGEDLDRYPRDLDNDITKLAAAGATALFTPSVEEVYPPGDATQVDVGPVAKPWEGASRPTHFAGVATVVLKLMLFAPADRAYFGQKDYQQTLVIKQLVRDLRLPIDVVVCPIIREADGLAMSSRNSYLTPTERNQALALSRSLQSAQQAFTAGERSGSKLQQHVEAALRDTPGLELEYAAVLAADSVEPAEQLSAGDVVVVAARVGTTRLIDNHVLE